MDAGIFREHVGTLDTYVGFGGLTACFLQASNQRVVAVQDQRFLLTPVGSQTFSRCIQMPRFPWKTGFVTFTKISSSGRYLIAYSDVDALLCVINSGNWSAMTVVTLPYKLRLIAKIETYSDHVFLLTDASLYRTPILELCNIGFPPPGSEPAVLPPIL